jgi:hypothetical protein
LGRNSGAHGTGIAYTTTAAAMFEARRLAITKFQV